MKVRVSYCVIQNVLSSLILCLGIKIELLETVSVSSLMYWHEIGLLAYRLEEGRYVYETGHRCVFWTKGRCTGSWRMWHEECNGFILDAVLKMGVACSFRIGS